MAGGWIGRLCLRRSLKSHHLRGKKERVEVCLLSEFDGEIEADLGDGFQLQLCLRNASTSELIGSTWHSRARNGVPNVGIFDILLPDLCGSYQYLVSATQTPENCWILPLISSVFHIVEEIPSDWTILCKAYRSLKFVSPHFSDVLIQEERGRTMGSHLWDSSLVLFKNFYSLLSPHMDLILERRSGLVAVELGAGCSLLGVAIAKYLHGQTASSHVFCTDLASQVPLIQDNLLLNCLEEKEISACELDWSSPLSLDAFHSRLSSCACASEGPTGVDLIIASDVLYQNEMTEHFFRTLSGLASPRSTLIFLAQKVRSNSGGLTSLDTVDLRTYPQYEASPVHQEAGVVVWQLRKR